MFTIRKVAVFGGSGTMGAPVVAALLKSGFDVTAITRPESTANFPIEVAVKRINTTSADSLTEALQGQDAVVSTVGTAAAGSQKNMIDAAIAAHVKRFIPSEFGYNLQEARGTKVGGLLKAKIEIVDYLIELSQKHEWFTWTGLSTGTLFDWTLRFGILGFDPKNKTAKIFDSGNEPYSASNLPFVGKSVAAILMQPEKTANKYLTVASFTITQNEVLAILQQETGTTFQVTNVKTADLEKIGDEMIAKGSQGAFFQYALQWMFADGVNHATKDNATQLLGLEEEDLRATIKKVLSEL